MAPLSTYNACVLTQEHGEERNEAFDLGKYDAYIKIEFPEFHGRAIFAKFFILGQRVDFTLKCGDYYWDIHLLNCANVCEWLEGLCQGDSKIWKNAVYEIDGGVHPLAVEGLVHGLYCNGNFDERKADDVPCLDRESLQARVHAWGTNTPVVEAAPVSEPEPPRIREPPPVNILVGLKCNAEGKFLDRDGMIVGELYNGLPSQCMRCPCDAKGNIKWGNKVIGKAKTVVPPVVEVSVSQPEAEAPLAQASEQENHNSTRTDKPSADDVQKAADGPRLQLLLVETYLLAESLGVQSVMRHAFDTLRTALEREWNASLAIGVADMIYRSTEVAPGTSGHKLRRLILRELMKHGKEVFDDPRLYTIPAFVSDMTAPLRNGTVDIEKHFSAGEDDDF